MKTVFINRVTLEGKIRIKLQFKFDPELIREIKKLPGILWDPDLGYWHFPDMEHPITCLRKMLHSKYRISYQEDIKQIARTGNQEIYYQEVPIEDRIYLKFNYNPEIINLIKTLDVYRWHSGRKFWSIKGGKNNFWMFIRIMLANNINPIEKDIHNTIKKNKKPELYKIRNTDLPPKLMNYMVLKNYSQRTIRIYKDHLSVFLNYWQENELKDISSEKIAEFVYSIMSATDYSRSYQNQMINAIKLYFRVLQNRTLDRIGLPRPKKEKKLPIVLSKDEIKLIINNTFNLKHRTIISLIYGTGIRLGETVNIMLPDIDFQRKLIHIRAGKGKKDRIVPLPEFLAKLLKMYLGQYKPIVYLFEGWGNQPYSPRSVQSLFKKALNQSNIVKNASVHTLRHTFATHSLEDGTDIRLIQEILGHSNIKTTEIYTHISNASILSIQSPIDKLGL